MTMVLINAEEDVAIPKQGDWRSYVELVLTVGRCRNQDFNDEHLINGESEQERGGEVG